MTLCVCLRGVVWCGVVWCVCVCVCVFICPKVGHFIFGNLGGTCQLDARQHAFLTGRDGFPVRDWPLTAHSGQVYIKGKSNAGSAGCGW